MIVLDKATVIFGVGTPLERVALRGVSLTLKPGEFVTVIGSNGAGKSTLLNTLSGENKLSQGRILFDEQDVTFLPLNRRASYVGRVFQDPLVGTCGSLTIEENMALAAARGTRRGLALASNRQLVSRFKDELSVLGLGLENRLHEKMSQLSGGQRQTVSLLMAALVGMKLLLLDEHTAALDPRTAASIMRLTDDLVRRGNLTTLMVTHSMRQALDHGTRTIMMHEGRIVLDFSGDDRKGLTVEDLLQKFSDVRAESIDDDALLLT